MYVEELKNLNIGQQFIDAWRSRGIRELTQIQTLAFMDDALQQGRNLLVIAPTTSGKTFIGEALAVRAASTLHRAIYLLPYKALAGEKYMEFMEIYGGLGISVVVSSGDYSEFDPDIRRGDFGIAIVVYEKLAQLLVQSPGIISDCHLMIVDEVQLIRDRWRGPLLEMLLARVKRLQPSPQIVCLSATVSDPGGFDSWLGAKVIATANRPVPLLEGVIEQPGKVTLHNVAEGKTEARDFAPTAVVSGNEELLDALAKDLAPNEQMLIFCTQVDPTERRALRLAQALPVSPLAGDVRDRIMALEDSPLRSFLERNIERRVAYHNAGLSVEERRLVEALFREGVLQVVVATTTLAAGVNLPADRVVIADYRRWDPEQRTRVRIDVAEYKNCAGRAGRLGIRSVGTSLLIAELPGQTNILENEYIYGSPPKLESTIPMQQDLARNVLGVIAEKLADTKSEIAVLFRDSFAFAQFYGPQGLETEMNNALESAVDQLLTLDLVEEQGGKLAVTPLGRVAARSGVTIETFGELERFARSGTIVGLNEYDVFIGITGLPEMERLRPFSAEHRAQVLSRWVGGESTVKLASDYSEDYSFGHGRIRELGEVAEWLLLTAAEIVVTLGEDETTVNALRRLASEAHFGLPRELIELAKLRLVLRSDLLRLMFNEKGIKLTSPHDVLDAGPEQFVGILAPQKVASLKEGIGKSIGESLARRKLGHLLRCDRLAAVRPIVARVYEAQGTGFDRALEELLNAQLVELNARRFTQQPSGQPDLEFAGANGTIVISATASLNDQKPVPWDKAREVLGSVGYTGKASNFVVIGKPSFHTLAIDNAAELAARGGSLLLVPVDVIVELCLRKVEGTISRDELISKLEDSRGYLSREALEAVA